MGPPRDSGLPRGASEIDRERGFRLTRHLDFAVLAFEFANVVDEHFHDTLGVLR